MKETSSSLIFILCFSLHLQCLCGVGIRDTYIQYIIMIKSKFDTCMNCIYCSHVLASYARFLWDTEEDDEEEEEITYENLYHLCLDS